MVVIPVIVGHLASRRFAAWEAAARRVAAIIANLAILWIIAAVLAKNAESFPQVDARFVLALLAVNLAGYAAGAAGGFVLRLSGPMRRALTLEIGMQNAGLGAVLAGDLFGKNSPEAIAPALYTFGCMFTGTILARLWAEFGRGKDAGVDGGQQIEN